MNILELNEDVFYHPLERVKKKIVSLLLLLVVVMGANVFMGSSPNYLAPKFNMDGGVTTKAFNLPKEIYFAGEKVPLKDFEVAERLDRELHINIYWQSNTLLSLKRAGRYFPIIIPILKRNGIPEDFKFLPLIESSFLHVISPAGAEGFWQFMPETGKNYGLEINREVDERYHLEKATEAACKYLREAYAVFGSWTMAAASYNMGANGLKMVKDYQKEDNYYDLELNEQTARYVFRLLAIKEVMEHPNRYNFYYSRGQLYQPLATYKLKVDTSIKNMVGFAKSQGINLKLLHTFNPWMKRDKLSNKDGKTYVIEIPKDKNAGLFQGEEDTVRLSLVLPQKPTKDSLIPIINSPIAKDTLSRSLIPVIYQVKWGDNLTRIAQKQKVKITDIIVWNKLENTKLRKGQELLIYRKPIENTASKETN
ncbi:MAG: transglycosylase SLT domain-containing protein [Bacteroidetes bacterium]|nr:transglycosylase SLT domain-containing protein [Bacteroidota bacterium]